MNQDDYLLKKGRYRASLIVAITILPLQLVPYITLRIYGHTRLAYIQLIAISSLAGFLLAACALLNLENSILRPTQKFSIDQSKGFFDKIADLFDQAYIKVTESLSKLPKKFFLKTFTSPNKGSEMKPMTLIGLFISALLIFVLFITSPVSFLTPVIFSVFILGPCILFTAYPYIKEFYFKPQVNEVENVVSSIESDPSKANILDSSRSSVFSNEDINVSDDEIHSSYTSSEASIDSRRSSVSSSSDESIDSSSSYSKSSNKSGKMRSEEEIEYSESDGSDVFISDNEIPSTRMQKGKVVSAILDKFTFRK